MAQFLTRINIAFALITPVLLMLGACSDRKTEKKQISEAQSEMVSADSVLADIDTASSGTPFKLIVEDDPSKISFKVSQDTLYRGDTLEMTFTSDTLLEVAVVKPNEEFYLLVSDQQEGDKRPLLKKDAFRKKKKLTIITDKTKAFPFKASATENKRIFDQTGLYQVRVSQNMHTDAGYLETQKIYYINKSR